MASPASSEEDLTPDLCFLEEDNEEEEEEEEISAPEPLMGEEDQREGLGSGEEDYREEESVPMGSDEPSEKAGGDFQSDGESLEPPTTLGSKRTMNHADRVRVLNLRRNLNELDNLAKGKEMMVQKTREELNACRSRIDMLTLQQRDVETDIEREKEAGNVASVFHLQAMLRRLRAELGNEKDLEAKIAQLLNENVFEMWKIEIEQGNFSELRRQVKRDEGELDRQQQEQAKERLRKQEGRAQQLNRRWLATERKIQDAQKDYEQRLPRALQDAQKNHEKAIRFLKSSLRRVREKEAKEEQKYQEYMQKRRETVLSLKQNIDSHREHLQNLQVLDKAKALHAQQQEQKIKEAIQAQGLNATRAVFLHKRQLEAEKKKKEFLEQQKARKLEIVAQILKEDAQLEKVKKQGLPQRAKRPEKLSDAVRWRLKTWRYIEEACDDAVAAVTQKPWRTLSSCDSLDDRSGAGEASQETVPEREEKKEEEEQRKTLAEPEFGGIWDPEGSLSKGEDDRTDSSLHGRAELEREIIAPETEKLHHGVINKPRVCGREFKGCPFYSKPSVIHFKDFDIGKTYKKKMVLINAFYAINYCKLVGVTEHLKDFITVLFDPPGPMSAGMSCEVGVTFKPMINEDLEGEVTFLSQIGSFSIPLKCSTKKCVLALDKDLIDFGTHVVGQTVSRIITLTNSGALGTRFQLGKSAGTDAAQMTTALPSTERTVSLSENFFSSHGLRETPNGADQQILKIVLDSLERPARFPRGIHHPPPTTLSPSRLFGWNAAHQNPASSCRRSFAEVQKDEKKPRKASAIFTADTNIFQGDFSRCPPPSVSEKGSSCTLEGSTLEKETASGSEEVVQHIALLDKLRPNMTSTNSAFEQFSGMVSQTSVSGEKPLSSLDVSRLGPPSEEELPEITLGEVTEGDIGPFTSIKLQIIFTPTVPGDVRADFEITFDNPDCRPLRFAVTAVSVAVPVWVRNPDVDLKICMYDRLYQDCIIVQSRATSALRLRFEVCKELANHMELLPKTGYIQAQSSFSVQLKFLPRHSLREDAGKYFDEKTRVLQVPMTIIVSDQSKPVEFTVHAVVTTSDLEISPTELDFGYCSIYEAVRSTITLTNKSILPQGFGFVRVQEFVEIQPNDGFGVLLPLESLSLDVIFKAHKAKQYCFELTCKTEINRQFKVSCKAVGVHPPLELTHALIQFPPTALNDTSATRIHIVNSHVGYSRFDDFVPRIGDGEVAPVGPTSFQFLVPEDSPITIMPCVGTVLPGKKCVLEVSFHPVLCDQLIRQEAVHLMCQEAEAKAQMEKKARELELQKKKEEAMVGRKDGKKMASISFLAQPSKDKHASKPFEVPCPEDICPNSEEYIAAHLSLVRSFSARFDRYVIPCLVASGQIDEKRGAENLHFSPYNTLYLELHCPSRAPVVVVTSNNGRTFFNFGDVAVGHRIKKEVTIQNISQELLSLEYSLLNPFGPFLLANPILTLGEGESRALVLSFCPEENKSFFETLELRSEKATLTLTLTGRGVITSIACSVEGDVFNMGYVIAKETATATFKIENTSTLPLKYTIVLESLSPNRDQDLQKLPPFLSSRGTTDLVGTQNYSGLSVFTVTPVEGVIGLGKFQEFTVTFSPDHESLYYSDNIQVLLFDKEVICEIRLKGAARNHMMFVEGGDPLDVPVESLAVTTSLAEEAGLSENEKATNSLLISLECVQSETFVIPAVRELRVGAIRTTQFASKKNVEFSWESLQVLQLKGFTVDPVKGTVERGQTKTINISWVPPAGSDPIQPVTGSAILTVKGDVKEIYSVYFMGRIVTRNPAD
nr:cilia- and flagella-associated protein 74 [Pogona vitticeps]